MPRKYRHIKEYEKEILELKNQGLTHRQIGERLGFSKEQIKGYLKRHNKSTQKQNASTLPASVQRLGKTAQLEYEISRKDCRIKQLEMENELLRDFLLLTERK